ncbi:MAG TPA: lytic transglycosylase domain-containing protein [Myxococcales bacterium]|nr:lytic transglycosylase domain-containing protein [Myxococcales bacterium]
MTGAVASGARVSAPGVRRRGPAGRRGAASRRRSLGVLLALLCGASSAGAVLGLLKQPDPGDQLDQFAFTTAAAVQVAREAQERAATAQAQLQAARSRLRAVPVASAAQELADLQEAERIGLGRLMKDSTAIWGEERPRVMATIVRESRRNGLDPALVAAVIQVESHFDPFAVSSVGARGLMQLMPPTAQWLLEKDSSPARIRPSHLFNPVLNIELGTSYLAHLMARFDGDLYRALIAYNAGPSIARSLQHGSKSWRRLSAYPRNVLAAYKSVLTPPQQVAAR